MLTRTRTHACAAYNGDTVHIVHPIAMYISWAPASTSRAQGTVPHWTRHFAASRLSREVVSHLRHCQKQEYVPDPSEKRVCLGLRWMVVCALYRSASAPPLGVAHVLRRGRLPLFACLQAHNINTYHERNVMTRVQCQLRRLLKYSNTYRLAMARSIPQLTIRNRGYLRHFVNRADRG